MEHLERKYKAHISKVLLDGFEQELLESAFVNLKTVCSLRFNNFAYALRELLRHVLHRLSPDNEVSQCVWFKPDPSSKTGFTRVHRMKYAIQGGLSDAYLEKKLGLNNILEITNELRNIIDLLSEYTHIEQSNFNLDIKEIERNSTECLDAVVKFVGIIATTKAKVIEMISGEIDQTLVNRVVCESVCEIMELSTHQSIEHIYSDEVNVQSIGSKSLVLNVTGNLECELQYGSGSDLRRGDGVVIPESFPFSGIITVEFIAPLGSSMKVDKLKVDTSSWYE